MAGLLGIELADAQKKTDLFTWFCFEKVEEASFDPGATVFRPNGPAFQRLVKLELTLDAGGTITAASLHVLRAFIESNAANAGDLVKSFIRYGDGGSLPSLVDDFMTLSLQRSKQPVIIRGELPTVDRKPPCFQVFADELDHAVVGNLTFDNRTENGASTFVVCLGGGSARPKETWLSRLLGR